MSLSTSLELMSSSSLIHAPLGIFSEIIFPLGKARHTDFGCFFFFCCKSDHSRIIFMNPFLFQLYFENMVSVNELFNDMHTW